MERYRVCISLEVEVEAYDSIDALEVVEDCFGPGDQGNLLVTEYKVLDYEPL